MYIDPPSRTQAFVPSVVNAGSCFAISSAADFERGMNFLHVFFFRDRVSGSFAQIFKRVTSEHIFYLPPSGLSESVLLSSSLYLLPEILQTQSDPAILSKYMQ